MIPPRILKPFFVLVHSFAALAHQQELVGVGYARSDPLQVQFMSNRKNRRWYKMMALSHHETYTNQIVKKTLSLPNWTGPRKTQTWQDTHTLGSCPAASGGYKVLGSSWAGTFLAVTTFNRLIHRFRTGPRPLSEIFSPKLWGGQIWREAWH